MSTPKTTEWKPIETAPKDGQQIILTNGVTVSQGGWLRINQPGDYGFDGWMDCEGGMQPDPTHWMPLPPAPGATPPEQAAQPADVAPIDMVLHCPACGMQHIDRDEALNFKPEGTCTCAGPDGPCEACEANREAYEELWRNPPHRSHLCGACGHIWRPADVPTNGVPAVKTKGKADGPIRSLADVARLVTTKAARDVLAERQRQIDVEGWTPECDDAYGRRQLARAAACYAIADGTFSPGLTPPLAWPWHASLFKPRDNRSNLVRAGALIMAEIERLDRAALAAKGGA